MSIKKHKGPWDEIINRAILIIPWILALAYFGHQIYTGDFQSTGAVRRDYIAYALMALFVFTYILALMKFYGPTAMDWVLQRGHRFMNRYNESIPQVEQPQNQNEEESVQTTIDQKLDDQQ
jgi:hypothetical protein